MNEAQIQAIEGAIATAWGALPKPVRDQITRAAIDVGERAGKAILAALAHAMADHIIASIKSGDTTFADVTPEALAKSLPFDMTNGVPQEGPTDG